MAGNVEATGTPLPDLCKALVVVPAYNEELTVGGVVSGLVARRHAVCVIDDGSTDGTAAAAKRAGAHVIGHHTKLGRGRALRTGLSYAIAQGFQRAVVVDGDGQHDVRDVLTLLDCMDATDADLVVGSRFSHPSGAYRIGTSRRLAMRLVTSAVSFATGASVTDSTSGFCAVQRPLLDKLAISYPAAFLAQTAGVLTETHLSGWRVVEIPVRMHRRRFGRPKVNTIMSLWYLVAVFVRIESLRWRHLLRARRLRLAPGRAVLTSVADQLGHQAHASASRASTPVGQLE